MIFNDFAGKYHLFDKLLVISFLCSLYCVVMLITGQPILAPLLQFYMNSSGLVVIVFNIVDMMSGKEAEEECMKDMKKWLNCAISHTYDKNTRQMASVVFVGTHVDQVMIKEAEARNADVGSSIVDDALNKICERISNQLNEYFHSSQAWPFLLTNKYGRNISGARTQLNFFAVNNKKGHDDTGLQMLKQTITEQVGNEQHIIYSKFSLQL